MKNCPLCQNKQYKVIYNFGAQKIVKCTQCDLARTIGKQSVDYNEYHRDEDYNRHEKQFKNIFTKRYKILSKFANKGRILDIGTSTGTMLDIFKENGWETYGVEPSKNYQIAKEKGHKIINTNFENAKLKSDFFDAVIMNHTLEHIENPLKVFKKINLILKTGGAVLIDVPNFGSLSSLILKSKWPYVLPNEHTYHFTPKTLTKIAEKSGFEVISIKSRSGLFEYASPVSELLQALLSRKKRFFTDLLWLPTATISTLLNKGNSFSLVAIKK